MDSYKYSDLNAGLDRIKKFYFMLDNDDLNVLAYRYAKQWRKFYGLNNKYKGNGELR